MIELLLVVTLLGVFISSCRDGDLGNPFQIYFSIWFFIFFLYWAQIETFIPISPNFLVFIFFESLVSLLLLLVFRLQPRAAEVVRPQVFVDDFQQRMIFFAQTVIVVALPFVFFRANELSGGEGVFSISGYTNLRYAVTEGESNYGFLTYIFVLSNVVCSLSLILFLRSSMSIWRLLLLIIVGLFYLYLNTARTSVLIFLILMVIPLVIMGVIGLRGVVASVVFLLMAFVFVAGMTAKGVSADANLFDNIKSFLDNSRSYTVAPILAFSDFIESDPPVEWGSNTFRFFIVLINAFGLSDVEPVRLIRDYSFVGMVKAYDPQTRRATIEQRNKIVLGDEIEVMGPNRKFFKQTITQMLDENGESITEAPHPQQMFSMIMDFPVKPQDILRSKKDFE